MNLIDLSFPVQPGMMVFTAYWHPQVSVEIMGRLETEGRETRKLILGTHSGTHIDAPTHFIKNGKTIDQITLATCIGKGQLISFVDFPVREITRDHLEEKLEGVSKIERLIVRFDWSKKFGSPSYYSEYPFFTEEACEWLVDKGVRLLGIDTPSPDDPRKGRGHHVDSPNHKILLQKGIFLLEYLTNLDQLKGSDIFIMALPLNILGADGAPARVVAYDLG